MNAKGTAPQTHQARGIKVLSGHTPEPIGEKVLRQAAWLAENPGIADLPPDKYGNGGLVRIAEERAAQLLGVETALLFPTGTMAQQAALKVWADRTGSRAVAIHPYAHPLRWENNAMVEVSGLKPRVVTPGPDQLTADDVRSHPGEFGSVFLELPLREPGFLLPAAEDLRAVVDAAHDRGAFVHVDGARLWESARHFGLPLERILPEFAIDSAYLGLDKALGAPSGAFLVGDKSFIQEAQAWRHEFGGRAHELWPVALPAVMAMERELPRLPEYVDHAPVVAESLAAVDGLAVFPNPPHTHQFQVWAPGTRQELTRAAALHTEESGTRLFSSSWRSSDIPGMAVAEVTVAGPALGWEPQEITARAEEFISVVRREAHGEYVRGIARSLGRDAGHANTPAPEAARRDTTLPTPVPPVKNAPDTAYPTRLPADAPVNSSDAPRVGQASADGAESSASSPISPVPAPVAERHERLTAVVSGGFAQPNLGVDGDKLQAVAAGLGPMNRAGAGSGTAGGGTVRSDFSPAPERRQGRAPGLRKQTP
ncbi:beta-eliminating lyase-related protein [Yinghuangia sp. ASG 101]|uniref:threonine aldolase family protein n=1 Tax=Yinghuangia sp. ASG 101 TaxID=2896848 RepID=UPI001E29BDD7|nr:beta-eliminating lyase-related protein [Yinghuangia sp. ASG 101]UGQ11633.1 beta-eliminating lyase-related protein [Yinghuangia sp. ASG 101]